MTQPTVPWYFATIIVVAQAMLTFAIVNSAQVNLSVGVLYLLGIVSVGLTTLAAVLNIAKPASKP